MLLTEERSTTTSPSSSPRIPELVPPKELPPQLLLFQSQFKASDNRADDSPFVKDVKKIIDEYKPLFSGVPSRYFSDLWQKRKKDLIMLEAACELSHITKKDLPLFQICRDIAIQDDGLWVNIMVNWNFAKKLKALQIKYSSQTNVGLRLQPPVDENYRDLVQKLADLYCHYLIVQSEVITLKTRLDASLDFKALQSRIAQYLQELTLKQQALQSLAEEKMDLEKRIQDLIQAGCKQAVVNRGNLDKIKILEEKVAHLTQELKQAHTENKSLTDANTLLGHQVKRLSPASTRYVSQELGVSQENKDLRAKLRSAEEEVKQKDKEIAALKAASAEKAKLRTRDQNQFRKFNQAAGANRVLVEDAKQVVARLSDLGKELENSDISPAPVRPSRT